MKRKIKVILSCIVCLIVLLGAGITYKTYAKNKNDVAEKFFNPDSREYVKNMTIYPDETFEIEEYIISLDNSLYDREVGIGYAVFSIKRNDGNTISLEDFGQKYCIESYFTGGIYENFVIEGDTMYYYLGMEIATQNSPGTKDKIFIEKARTGEVLYEFNLISIDNNQKYVSGDYKVILSPVGLKICKDSFTRTDSVVLKYNNGTKEKVIVKDGFIQVDGDMNLGGGGPEGEYATTCSFKDVLDISDVSSILVDGVEYELVNE